MDKVGQVLQQVLDMYQAYMYLIACGMDLTFNSTKLNVTYT